MKQDEEIKDLRDHLRFCINEAQNRFTEGRRIERENVFKIKYWAISVFIATSAFCITQFDPTHKIFYYLPFAPILIFWLLYAYEDMLVLNRTKSEDYKKLGYVLANLYYLPFNELKEYSRSLFDKKERISDERKEVDVKRFFFKKLPTLFKAAFCVLSTFSFFASMAIVWLAIIYIEVCLKK